MPATLEASSRVLPAPLRVPRLRRANSFRRAATALSLVGLSVCLTGANLTKPLHVDDAAYVAYAAHIAKSPLAPYNFEVYWDYQVHQANHVLAPPVFLYWMAGVSNLFGDDPLFWKLSLLPFHVTLVVSLFSLLRRWAAPLAMPLTWMAILSPAVLPSTNLMLDVPALALSLAALAVFVQALERNSMGLGLVSGLLAGVAMQTKYTALVAPAVILLYGIVNRRLTLAVVATAASLALFASWEFVIWLHTGESHFLYGARLRQVALPKHVRHLLLPTATPAAALAPGVLFTAILTWRRPGRWLAGAIAGMAGGFLCVGLFDASAPALYAALMVVWWSVLGAVIVRNWPRREGVIDFLRPAKSRTRLHRSPMTFLLFWLGLEFAGAVLLSPFPAARRVLGVTMAASVLIGYVAVRAGVGGWQPLGDLMRTRWLTWTATAASITFGVAVMLIDAREAHATRELVESARHFSQRENNGGRAWFSGIWAFQFYAMNDGMMPIVPGQSELRTGDLVFLPEQQIARLDFRPEQMPLDELEVVTIEDRLPWRTLVCYYAGATPVRGQAGPRLRMRVYRVTRDFVPQAYGSLAPKR